MARYTCVPGLCLCSRVSTDNGEMKSSQEKPCYRASPFATVPNTTAPSFQALSQSIGDSMIPQRRRRRSNLKRFVECVTKFNKGFDCFSWAIRSELAQQIVTN